MPKAAQRRKAAMAKLAVEHVTEKVASQKAAVVIEDAVPDAIDVAKSSGEEPLEQEVTTQSFACFQDFFIGDVGVCVATQTEPLEQALGERVVVQAEASAIEVQTELTVHPDACNQFGCFQNGAWQPYEGLSSSTGFPCPPLAPDLEALKVKMATLSDVNSMAANYARWLLQQADVDCQDIEIAFSMLGDPSWQ